MEVQHNGESLQSFYQNDQFKWKKPFGVIEIFTNKLYQQLLKNGADSEAIKYGFQFKRRATYWKYVLMDQSFHQYDTLLIEQNKSVLKTNEKALRFKKPNDQLKEADEVVTFRLTEDEIQLKHTKPIVFVSDSPIGLSEYYEQTFQLVEHVSVEDDIKNVIIKELKTPKTDQLFLGEAESDQKIYSHIYI